MKAEVMIDRIWDIWVKRGLVSSDMRSEYETEMNYLYAGGFDEGRKQVAHRKRVAKLDNYGKILEIYDSAQEAANKNGLTKHMISKVCLGRISRAGERINGVGFLYKYIDDEKTEPESNNGE